MKRDMDLAREILMVIERDHSPDGTGFRVEIPERSESEVNYHVGLLVDAGLVDAIDVSSQDGAGWLIREGLTWDGHEFLDAARDPERWESAKRTVREKTGAIGFEAIKEVLMQLLRDAMLR